MAKLLPPFDRAEKKTFIPDVEEPASVDHVPDHDRDDVAQDRPETLPRLRDGTARKRAPRKPAARWARCLGSILVMLVLLAGALGGGLYWRLGNGPLDAPMLVDRALAAIAGKLPPGYGAELGNVQFERRDGRLSIILDHLALRGSDGKALVTAPRVVVGLSGASLLLGAPEPQAITVEGATATMIIGADSRIRFQAAPLAPSGEAGSAADVMRAFDTLLAATSSIDAVEMRDATLVMHDEALRRDATYAGIDFTVRRTAAAGGNHSACDWLARQFRRKSEQS